MKHHPSVHLISAVTHKDEFKYVGSNQKNQT